MSRQNFCVASADSRSGDTSANMNAATSAKTSITVMWLLICYTRLKILRWYDLQWNPLINWFQTGMFLSGVWKKICWKFWQNDFRRQRVLFWNPRRLHMRLGLFFGYLWRLQSVFDAFWDRNSVAPNSKKSWNRHRKTMKRPQAARETRAAWGLIFLLLILKYRIRISNQSP